MLAQNQRQDRCATTKLLLTTLSLHRNSSRPKSAIEKEDYATAEPLLKKVIAAGSRQLTPRGLTWDFVYNALGKTDDSIAAYRKSVAAKPEFSNPT